MAESTTMVASAVVIPQETRSPSPNLKRKLSASTSPSTEHKRARVDTSEPPALSTSDITVSSETITTPTTTDSTHDLVGTTTTAVTGPAARSKPQPTTTTTKTRSRTDLPTTTEEKQRSRRLFSGLIGTLSQKPPSNARPTPYARRDEIANRALARQKAEQAGQEVEAARKRREVDARRRNEQVQWDREGRELRWKREREFAGFLRTKTEPGLYYRPWELRAEEEERIRGQKEEVEKRIERERRTFEGDGANYDDEEEKNEKNVSNRQEGLVETGPREVESGRTHETGDPGRSLSIPDAADEKSRIPTDTNPDTDSTSRVHGTDTHHPDSPTVAIDKDTSPAKSSETNATTQSETQLLAESQSQSQTQTQTNTQAEAEEQPQSQPQVQNHHDHNDQDQLDAEDQAEDQDHDQEDAVIY